MHDITAVLQSDVSIPAGFSKVAQQDAFLMANACHPGVENTVPRAHTRGMLVLLICALI